MSSPVPKDPVVDPHAPPTDPDAPPFDEFDLDEHLLQGLEDAGYAHPTPVQVATLPPMLEGREVVVQARTGTGKTAAFGLPLLELLDPGLAEVQALVLTPTRELAHQVAREVSLLGIHGEVRATAVSGGHSMTRQVEALRAGAQIVVGTPGRVLDHLRRRTLRPRHVDYLVLDEADEMLSMGFARELNAILSFLPDDRKTSLFSATFPPEVERLIERHVRDGVRLSLSSDAVLPEAVEHHYYLAPAREKDRHLVAVLDEERVESAIVFCNRRDETRMVANVLRRAGFHAMPINSDLTQKERDEVMAAIRRGELNILVATDIAARGIDVSHLSHVINYSVPDSPEQYVHRSGRTGRIGRRGTAVTLVGATELSALKQIESLKGLRIEERRLPAEEVVMARRVERLVSDLKHLAELKSPEDKVRGEREELRRVAQTLVEEDGGDDVVYMLLQCFLEGIRPATRRAANKTSLVEDGDSGAEGDAPPARKKKRTKTTRAPRRTRQSEE